MKQSYISTPMERIGIRQVIMPVNRSLNLPVFGLVMVLGFMSNLHALAVKSPFTKPTEGFRKEVRDKARELNKTEEMEEARKRGEFMLPHYIQWEIESACEWWRIWLRREK